MIDHAYSLPAAGGVKLNETHRRYLDFVTENQLLDKTLWSRFTGVFGTGADDADRGWRGEYWGKMMRGGCLVYRCTADERLYGVLEDAVTGLLSAAEKDGRLSTYSRAAEFSGWDIWCRKYVLTGMLHFCDICKDEALKERILDCMEKHLDRIMEKVGPLPGQKAITETSDYWLGVNSCSILEPVIDLYSRRPEKRFLDFAEYIVSTGGCSGGDLISLALENEKAPYEYPETKAYETMSFFEGVLAYYEVTGKKRYLDAVLNFAEKVSETDITIIGCAGCTHELFDHSAVRQTLYAEQIMQETCVTVTWMRLCAKLFLLTGDEKYAGRIERSALNALYGSVNLYSQRITMSADGDTLPPLPFDSYSPLFMNRRGRRIGGLKFFEDGAFYGCCAAIGAAGLAVYPLFSSLTRADNTNLRLEAHRLNGCVAFTFGPYVLARDAAKEKTDITLPVDIKGDEPLKYESLAPENGEAMRIRLRTADGPVLLTDYASCGKRWAEEAPVITVWMPVG